VQYEAAKLPVKRRVIAIISKLKIIAGEARHPHDEGIQPQVIQAPVHQGTAADGTL
jgi:hypothetical protein